MSPQLTLAAKGLNEGFLDILLSEVERFFETEIVRWMAKTKSVYAEGKKYRPIVLM